MQSLMPVKAKETLKYSKIQNRQNYLVLSSELCFASELSMCHHVVVLALKHIATRGPEETISIYFDFKRKILSDKH